MLCPLVCGFFISQERFMGQTQKQLAEQEYFTVAAAVLYLKGIGLDDVTEWSLHQRIRQGKLPHLQVGRKFKVAKSDLHSMLEKSKRRGVQ
jgi:hypothetical protein